MRAQLEQEPVGDLRYFLEKADEKKPIQPEMRANHQRTKLSSK